MALLLGGAALLILGALGAALGTVSTLRQDAVVINLAGRQRMLLQQMGRDALLADQDPEAALPSLKTAIDTFDRSLWALTNGGTAPYNDTLVTLPGTRQPETLAALGDLHRTWDVLRAHLETLTTEPPGSPAGQRALEAALDLIPTAVRQADAVVRAFETDSTQKVRRLTEILAGFAAGAVGLLALSAFALRRWVLTPLQHLGNHADRIAAGDLAQPVAPVGAAEFARLAQRFEAMRQALGASQEFLEGQIQRRTSELEALHQVSQEILSQLDLDQVLLSVTEKARQLLNAEVAFICLADARGDHLRPRAVCGPSQAFLGSAERADLGLAALPRLCRVEDCAGACDLVTARYRTSHLAAPLRIGEQVVGTLCVAHSAPEAFSQEDQRLLAKLGAIAAIAVQNARLYERAEQAAMVEERRRMAAEMHDGLAQWMSYLKLQAEQLQAAAGDGQQELAEALGRLQSGLEAAAQEVRRTIDQLQQEDLPLASLQEQVLEVARAWQAEHGLGLELEVATEPPLVLPRDMTENVLRVLGEALQNVARHAQASRVTLRLTRDGDQMRLSVEDDGIGFDATQPARGGRFGLSIMRARAHRLGGQLHIDSALGRGTRLSLIWPARQALWLGAPSEGSKGHGAHPHPAG